MNFLLEITENDYGTNNLLSKFSFGEVLMFGGKMLLIGVIAVFSVLCIIWLILAVFGRVFNKAKPKIQAEAKVEVKPVEEIVYTETDDSEIVAVIAAAIAMAESETTGVKFRVVSFKRK